MSSLITNNMQIFIYNIERQQTIDAANYVAPKPLFLSLSFIITSCWCNYYHRKM